MTTLAPPPVNPWYREPWPWLLMLGPVTVIIAGIITVMLAVDSYDGLVADDYYKRGLAVNQELKRIDRATTLQLQASFTIDANGQVALNLRGQTVPGRLLLRLVHPTRAGQDHTIDLEASGDGWYRGRVPPPLPARSRVRLEGSDWLLTGEHRAHAKTPTILLAQP